MKMIDMTVKTFHLITNFEENGGAEAMLVRLLNELNTNDLTLVSIMKISPKMRAKLPGHVSVVELGADSALTMLLSVFKLLKLMPKSARVYCWMYHANVIGGLYKLLRLRKTYLIWGVRHSLDYFEGESFSSKLAIKLGAMLKYLPNKVVNCSLRSQRQHIEFGYNLKNNAIYIPNGYTFLPLEVRDFNKPDLMLGAAGRFHEAKDYQNLFKALTPIFKNDSGLKIRLCGRGMCHDNAELIELINKAEFPIERAELLGDISDMDTFYRSLDLFILSSKTEGFPNVLAEAAATGCAVISTDVGDAREIVNDDSRIVPPQSAKKLQDAVTSFLKLGSEDKAKIALHSASHVRNSYSIEKVAHQYEQIGKI